MSVNSTPKEFCATHLASESEDVTRSRLDPRCLQLEIIEAIANGAMPKNPGRCWPQLKALGVRLSIEIFRHWAFSLSRLRRIPVDTLENPIGLHYETMDTDPENRAISARSLSPHNLG